MHILLVNDDGFYAKGIQELYLSLKDDYDVTIVAPYTQQSAKSHSITYFYDKMIAHHVALDGARDAWALEGTPADCVYCAIHGLMNEKPDLLISGINKGPNLSTDCLYSGTVGAAQEGRIYGIPSIAVSLASNYADDYLAATRVVKELIPSFMEDEDKQNYVLNVNIPYIPYEEIKGIRVTRFEGLCDYHGEIKTETVNDELSYLTIGEPDIIVKNSTCSLDEDITAVESGFVSLTPLQMDWTDYRILEKMQDIYGKGF